MNLGSTGFTPNMPLALPGQKLQMRPSHVPSIRKTLDDSIYGSHQSFPRHSFHSDNIAHYHIWHVPGSDVAIRSPIPTSIPGRPSWGARVALFRDRPIR